MFELSERAQDFISKTKSFIENEIEPIEADFWHEVRTLNPDGNWKNWTYCTA